jgi:hypothetical protein
MTQEEDIVMATAELVDVGASKAKPGVDAKAGAAPLTDAKPAASIVPYLSLFRWVPSWARPRRVRACLVFCAADAHRARPHHHHRHRRPFSGMRRAATGRS